MKNAMMNRKSVREYSDEKLSDKHRKLINDYLSDKKNLKGILNNDIRINLVDAVDSIEGRIGAYGNITGATSFLITMCKDTRDMMIDLGYVFEKLVLYLQSKGLNTCWQGATFDRDVFSISAELGVGEFIPIISPVGIGAAKPVDMDYEKRTNKRADLDILYFKDDFKTPVDDSEFRKTLEHVRFAPSAINGQPCRILFDKKGVAHFYIARHPKFKDNALPIDVQMIDMGIAICHYILATGKSKVINKAPDVHIPSNITEYILSVQ